MPTNAGEVKITLAANAAEFKKVLQDAIRLVRQLQVEATQLRSVLGARLKSPIDPATTQAAQRSFTGLTASATNFGREGEKAGRRTSQSITQANQSVTLLVAKFALLTFAIQTVANIIDSTFGAALRNIDEFEQGVVSTAAAITNIADLSGGATFGQAFAQNLQFVRGAFQELEGIAGKFFSSANDLQLAYNTLAARGVVLRREEFNTLGLITDQIKLQTKGQVSSIQIAQELRNLFTGQVRAADQLAQLIRAQGGNVKQISDELRKTGSLKPLEPFVAGLREAQGVLQGLLTPALENFDAIIRRIGRLAFSEVFAGTVSTLQDINQFLNQNQQTIGAIIGIVFNRLARAFEFVLSIVKQIAPVLTTAFGGVLATGLARILTIAGAFFTVQRIIILIVAKVTEWTIGFDNLFKIAEAVFNLFLASLRLILTRLQQTIDFVLELLKDLAAFTGFTGLSKFFGEFKVEDAVSNINKLTAAIDKAAGTTGKNKNSITDYIKEISSFFSISQDEIQKFIAKNQKAVLDSPFATKQLAAQETETATLRRVFRAQRALREAEAKRNLQVDLNAIQERQNAIKLSQALLNTTEAQGFLQRQALLREETRLQLESIQTRIEAEKDAVRQQRVELQFQINRGKTEKDRLKAENDLRLLNAQSATKLANLDKERLTVEQGLTNELTQQNAELIKTRRQISQLIAQRQRDVDLSFAQTVTDRLKNLTIQQNQEINRLNQQGATPAQISALQSTQTQARLLEAIKTPLTAALSAIDQAFNSLIDGILQGSLNFKQIAQSLGTTLIKGGLQDLLSGLKKSLVDGLTNLFKGLGNVAAQQAAAALAVGIGLLLAVLSKVGNQGSFTPTGGGTTGSLVNSTQQVRGIIGGNTSIPIADINVGLQEALIPTNNILSTIERNTRSLAELNLNIDSDQLASSIQNKISDILDQALLQAGA